MNTLRTHNTVFSTVIQIQVDLTMNFTISIKRFSFGISEDSLRILRACIKWKGSLRSRHLEVVGTRKNGRARRRHARGERAPARKAPENRFQPPFQLPGSRCVICQKFWQKTTELAQTKRAAKKRSTFYLRSNYICYKDQLGYLIIERWSNKLMVNTQL